MSDENNTAKSPGIPPLPLVVIFLAPLLSFAVLLAVWPKSATWAVPSCAWLCWITPDIRLMLIVLAAGAAGSTIHMARSFAYFKGMGKFDENWNAWYWLRVPVGMGLALLLYLVLRGGLFVGTFNDATKVNDTVNPYGFAALSALAGMFARQASQRLEKIFDAVFQDDDDANGRKPSDTLSITPFKAALKVGMKDPKLTVSGKGFRKESKVFVGETERPTEHKGPTELIATLTADDVKTAGKLSITVKNSDGVSEPVELTISA